MYEVQLQQMSRTTQPRSVPPRLQGRSIFSKFGIQWKTRRSRRSIQTEPGFSPSQKKPFRAINQYPNQHPTQHHNQQQYLNQQHPNQQNRSTNFNDDRWDNNQQTFVKVEYLDLNENNVQPDDVRSEFERDIYRIYSLTEGVMDQKLRKQGKSQLMIVQAEFRKASGQEGRKVYVFIDSGAERSLITTSLAEEIGAPVIQTRKARWHMIDGCQTESVSKTVRGILRSSDGVEVGLILQTIDQCTGTLSYTKPDYRDRLFMKNNRISEPADLPNEVRPDILLGMDYFNQIVQPQNLFCGLPSGKVITATTFGPVITGLSVEERINLENCFNTGSHINHIRLGEAVQQMVNLENIGISDSPSKEAEEIQNQQFEDYFQRTTLIRNGQVWIRLPFKQDYMLQGDNLSLAMSRLIKSKNSPKMLSHGEEYGKIFQEQLKNGIIKEVKDPFDRNSKGYDSTRYPEEELYQPSKPETTNGIGSNLGSKIYYIPHSGVIKESSQTTKLRMVYDASASMNGYPSLNDCLNPGPVILPDLFALMNNMRVHRFTILYDVEKAFHTIHLQEEDRDPTRFLWWKDLSKPSTMDNVVVYRFTRLPFGLGPSPAILGRAITFCFSKYYPELVRYVDKCLYVDNLVIGTDLISEILRLCILSKKAVRDFSMNLREFCSNYLPLLEQLPKEDLAKEVYRCKILGIRWNTDMDMISFLIQMKIAAGKVTRRSVLAATSSIYDPLGLVSPILLRVKHFGQKLWEGDRDWDDYVGKELEEEWNMLATEIHGSTLGVPRRTLYYEDNMDRRFHLYCFVDASEMAMCCCLYIVTEYWRRPDSGEFSTEPAEGQKVQRFSRLQCAKVRLIPKDLTDMPRMELVAIFMGTNLSDFLISKFEQPFKSLTVFSDSTIAIAQIRRGEDEKTFVHNRVRHINSVLKRISTQMPVKLKHVDTSENPADIGTRGLEKKDYDKPRWWKGCTWLELPTEEWPETIEEVSFTEPEEIIEESKPATPVIDISTYTVTRPPKQKRSKKDKKPEESAFVLYDKVKTFNELVDNVVESLKDPAYSETLKEYCETVTDPFKLSDDLLEARMEVERFIIREHQRSSGISKKVHPLYHIVDQHGIIRLRGRVKNNQLEENVNCDYPILLSGQKQLTSLLARKAHEDCGHGGRNETIVKFWESFTCNKGVTILIRKAVRECFECRRWSARPYSYPDPPLLPVERVEVSKPFQYIGLDYAGPFKVKNDHDPTSDGSECKVWVSLITCFVTRAVYLAIFYSLSNKEFIHMFTEFVSKKGCPALVLLDNQPSFESGGQLLKDMFIEQREMNDSQSEDESCNESIRTDVTQPDTPEDFEQIQKTLLGPEMKLFFKQKQIRFQHITPLSPWKGAIYKRMVGVFKTTLYKSAPASKVMPYRLFQSLVSHAECCVNNRPLSAPSPGFGYVTPRMLCEPFADPPAFLVNPFEAEINYNAMKSHEDVKNWLDEVSQVQERNWKIWKTTWIDQLRHRVAKSGAKGKSSKFEARVGDYCLMMDDLKTRRFWLLGKITQLTFSTDGAVRAAKVQFTDPETKKTSEVERSVCRLCCMEIRSGEKPEDFVIADTEREESQQISEETQQVLDEEPVVPEPVIKPKRGRGRPRKEKPVLKLRRPMGRPRKSANH